MIDVSVIIPVYNAEAYLRRCLDSVANQTLRNIEILCVDDGSTDTSTAILGEYAAKDSRVKVLAQDNAGPGAARNRGMQMASGGYLAFMDADDMFPDMEVLADLMNVVRREGAKVCGGGLEELLPNGSVRKSFSGIASHLVFSKEGFVDFRDYAYDYGYTRFIYSAEMLRSNGIEFPRYRRFEDPPFMVKALAAAGSFYAIARPTYRYRVEIHPVDWRKDGMRKARDLLLGISDVAVLANELDMPRLADVVLHQACEQHAEVLLDDGIVAECRDETAKLCRAFHVASVSSLLALSYPGRTSIFCRRAKLSVRRNFRGTFRVLRFMSDVFRHGLPYAVGRFRGCAS